MTHSWKTVVGQGTLLVYWCPNCGTLKEQSPYAEIDRPVYFVVGQSSAIMLEPRCHKVERPELPKPARGILRKVSARP